jgi:hypothetical protein
MAAGSPGRKMLLCEFCSKIDWECIRAPTVGELRELAAGRAVPRRHPFMLKPPDWERVSSWDLGTMARVLRSADACPLCDAVSGMFHEANSDGRPGRLTADMACTLFVDGGYVTF